MPRLSGSWIGTPNCDLTGTIRRLDVTHMHSGEDAEQYESGPGDEAAIAMGIAATVEQEHRASARSRKYRGIE